jgi:hypothetical protein
LGMWSNETISYFFHGIDDSTGVGIVSVGPNGIPIVDMEYQLFIDNGNPFFKLINTTKKPVEIKTYTIESLNMRSTNELVLIVPLKGEIVLHRNGAQY